MINRPLQLDASHLQNGSAVVYKQAAWINVRFIPAAASVP